MSGQLYVIDFKVDKVHCLSCQDKLEETYRLLYDPKYKNKETEESRSDEARRMALDEQSSFDSILDEDFDGDEQGWFEDLNLPENCDE